jgi:methionyl-tRNA formyltransferase
MPSLGTINLHASLLPKHRGAAPINWAIINGEKESGVTTFFIQKDIDTGNIIHQEKAIISNSDNAGTLHDKLMIIGAELICKTVDDITTGIAPNIEQKGSVSHAPKIFKQDCKVNWNQECKNIHNFIRGLSPYPTAFTNLSSDKSLKIYQTSIEIIEHQHSIGKIFSDKKSQMKIAVKDGFIHLEDVQISGKKRMRIDAFLRGFKMNENIHTT